MLLGGRRAWTWRDSNPQPSSWLAGRSTVELQAQPVAFPRAGLRSTSHLDFHPGSFIKEKRAGICYGSRPSPSRSALQFAPSPSPHWLDRYSGFTLGPQAHQKSLLGDWGHPPLRMIFCRSWKLGRGLLCLVLRSTAQSPNLFLNPRAHS